MDEIPPHEAFEPQPDEPGNGGRARRRFQVAVTLTVVASIIVLAAIEGGGFIPRRDVVETPRPPAALLAMVDAAGALATTDDQGVSVIPYAMPGVTFQFPAWSPDGSHIAAVGASSKGGGIYVFAARAAADPPSDPVVIYQSADRRPFYLYWTPDSKQVTFLTTEPDGLALRIAPADASAAAATVRAGAPMYWDFVDSGRLLVHSGASGPDGFLAEVALSGGPIAETGRSPGTFRAPAISSTGQYRAYVAADEAFGQVVLESRGADRTSQISVFGPAAFSFNPDISELAFIAPDHPPSGDVPLPIGPLRLVQPGNSNPTTLFPGSVVAFFWSPTGKQIAILRLENPDNVTQANRGDGVALARANIAAQGIAIGLSMRLAFVDVRTGSVSSERVVRLSDLFINQVLPFFDQYARSHRFWSPDGAAIALPIVNQDGATQIVAIPADGSEARAVARAEMAFWRP